MPDLRARFPALEVYLREEQTLRLIERLHAGELDAAIGGATDSA